MEMKISTNLYSKFLDLIGVFMKKNLFMTFMILSAFASSANARFFLGIDDRVQGEDKTTAEVTR